MSEAVSDTTVENYKGILQQYCQKRALGDLTYETDQQGMPNEPSWIVTVKYGETTYTTPAPIPGSKRWAEQTAAKQVLEQIESHQEVFLSDFRLISGQWILHIVSFFLSFLLQKAGYDEMPQTGSPFIRFGTHRNPTGD